MNHTVLDNLIHDLNQVYLSTQQLKLGDRVHDILDTLYKIKADELKPLALEEAQKMVGKPASYVRYGRKAETVIIGTYKTAFGQESFCIVREDHSYLNLEFALKCGNLYLYHEQ